MYKGRGTRVQIANIYWIIEKTREFQKNIYFCFTDNAKTFDCMDHNKLGKILKEMGIPDHLTCFMQNLYAGQEVTVRTGHGTTDCGKSLKGWEYWTTLPASWETYMQVKRQQLELDMEQQTGSKLGKEYIKANILSPCLFNLYAENMRNGGLDESQAGIKTSGRNINNLRYAEDTTLMAEGEEELKSLLMKVKEKSEKLA